MKKLLLILSMLAVTNVYAKPAKPNYSGDYTGVLTYQVNEALGSTLAEEGEPFSIGVGHNKGKIFVTDFQNFEYQGRRFKKIPEGFEVNETWKVEEGGYDSYCTAQEIIRVTSIKKKSAMLFYLLNADCTDGTFFHSSATIPLQRKARKK